MRRCCVINRFVDNADGDRFVDDVRCADSADGDEKAAGVCFDPIETEGATQQAVWSGAGTEPRRERLIAAGTG